jgi:hypothetical protein
MTRIFTVVTYGIPKGTDREAAVQMFRNSVPRYMATDGLLRKNVLYREGLGGGAYLWESQEAADKAFSPEWRAYMTEKYGHPPSIDSYEMPITMDREYDTVFDEGAVDEAAE